MLNSLDKWIKEWLFKKDWSITIEKINGVFYPTEESVIKLHDYVINEFKLSEDPISRGIISKGVLSFPGVKYYFEGDKNNKRKDILFRGAHIFNKFLQAGHPFADGNKRTGLIILWIFLFLNGYFLRLSDYNYESHAKLIIKWADIGEDNISEIYEWLDKYVTFI